MDVDPRLQNIAPVDFDHFPVPPLATPTGFEPNYANNVYGSGLNGGHPHAHSHVHPQYVEDGGRGYFEPEHAQQVQQQRQQRQQQLLQQKRPPSKRARLQSANGADVTLDTRRSTTQHPPGIPHRNSSSSNSVGAGASFNQSPINAPQADLRAPNPFIAHATPLAQTSPVQRRGLSFIPNGPNTSFVPQQNPETAYPPPNRTSTSSSFEISQYQPRAQPNPAPRPHSLARPTHSSPLVGSLTTPKTPTTSVQAHNVNTSTTTSVTQDLSSFHAPSTFPLVADPPNLAAWREKFFNIAEPLLLTSEEYHTYFPHVDNIYSHRSTQKYKKKPFVSHYWDCRLKGRPTGTPLGKTKKKSGANADDHNEDGDAAGGDGDENREEGSSSAKKRKRKTRERDLCDVKIKVTEFFGRDELEALRQTSNEGSSSAIAGGHQTGHATSGNEGDIASMVAARGGGAAATGGSGHLTFVLEDGTPTNAASNNFHLQGNPNRAGNSNSSHATFSIDVGSIGKNKDASEMFESLNTTYPEGHPGATGRRWYMIQRVNGTASSTGTGKDGSGMDGQLNHSRTAGLDTNQNLDHKHSIEESDRIKKNSVQRWLLAQEKDKKKQARSKPADTSTSENSEANNAATTNTLASPQELAATAMACSGDLSPSFHASGIALQTANAHAAPAPTQITLFASSFCPFAQRLWIALEVKGIPYQYVEVRPSEHVVDGKCTIPELLQVNPAGTIPCIRHGNWGIADTGVALEYLEDLGVGSHALLPMTNPQLRAHSRLWIDHINRKILPLFYALLLLPNVDETGEPNSLPPATDVSELQTRVSTVQQRQAEMISSLQSVITDLVNASHAHGPFFLGEEISFVDVAFAPWIIRISRVLSYYRGFPRPEVGTRWYSWTEAVENHECVRSTVSEDQSYRGVYGGPDGKDVGRYQRKMGGEKLAAMYACDQASAVVPFGSYKSNNEGSVVNAGHAGSSGGSQPRLGLFSFWSATERT